jgi:hypothetical protein
MSKMTNYVKIAKRLDPEVQKSLDHIKSCLCKVVVLDDNWISEDYLMETFEAWTDELTALAALGNDFISGGAEQKRAKEAAAYYEKVCQSVQDAKVARACWQYKRVANPTTPISSVGTSS